MRRVLGVVCVGLALLAGACVEGDPAEGPVLTYDQSLAQGGDMCGGIAGLQCPDGQRCLITEDYPDAAGMCVGAQDYNNHRDRCDLVRCIALACPEGFDRIYTPEHCCGMCVPSGGGQGQGQGQGEGSCSQPSDCEGLPHIMCVGSWSCERNQCSYTCDSGTLETF